MSDLPTVPVDQLARTYATDPRHHVVLEASAGTGKTRVLVDRYLALLAAGVDPRHVLAITFTRKAAAEMRDRIVAELRARHPDVWQVLRDRAHEIAVSTIDAFCFSLLREFPLEAGLDPGFALADETEVARLVEMAIDRTLRECRQRAAHDDGIRLVFAQLPLPRLAQGLRALLERRFVAPVALRQFLGRHVRDARSEASAAAALRSDLRGRLAHLPGGLAAWIDTGPAESPLWTLVRRDLADLLGAAPMTPAEVRAGLDGVSRWALTRDGKPRKVPTARKREFASPGTYEQHRLGLVVCADAVSSARRGFESALNVLLTRGIRRIFRLAHRRYLETLLLHDALDFSEVLSRAVTLLSQMDEFSRSRFRLESRYQHVLVDEFQDTSRLQWTLVASLVRAWGDGAGLGHEGALPPSIFLVGDRKQSIYRFRDAEVGLLDEAVTFVQALDGSTSVRQAISQSFRSHPDLLAFANDLAVEMVEPAAPGTVAFRYGHDDRFPLPQDHQTGLNATSPLAVVVADDIETCAAMAAAEIERLLVDGLVTDRGSDGPRRARPGDIAILFRSRESHREFERALSARAIPSYVYKGLGFYDSDEIKDLVALVRVLAAPESALRAAAFLRSGFVGISDDALRRLAPDLANRLSTPGDSEAGLPDDDVQALRRLRASWQSWLALVDRLPPADVVDRIVQVSAYACTWRGHRQVQARENVKKFRALLRRIQGRGYATMARVGAHVDRLSAGDESNAAVDAADAVNLMTIHASKGLEFPIVFLVNLTRGSGGFPPPLRVVPDGADDEPLVGIARYEPGATRAEQAHDREESKRLMYVAVTRARERLYLSAAAQRQGRIVAPIGSLASVCPPSLVETLSGALQAPDEVAWHGSRHLHRLRVCPRPASAVVVVPEVARVQTSVVVPASLLPLSSPIGTRRGSVTDLATAPRRGSGQLDGPAVMDRDLVTGRAVHRLLARGQSGEGLSSLRTRVIADLDADERPVVGSPSVFADEVTTLARSVWNDPTVRQALVSGAARFEVPIVFRHEEAGAVTLVRGTIDCLAPIGHRLVVFEFKTGHPQPSHRRQLALYVEAVRHSLPGRTVDGHLVYATTRSTLPASPPRLPFDELDPVSPDR